MGGASESGVMDGGTTVAEFTPQRFAEYLTAQAMGSFRSCPNEVARQEWLRMLDKQGTAAMPTARRCVKNPTVHLGAGVNTASGLSVVSAAVSRPRPKAAGAVATGWWGRGGRQGGVAMLGWEAEDRDGAARRL